MIRLFALSTLLAGGSFFANACSAESGEWEESAETVDSNTLVALSDEEKLLFALNGAGFDTRDAQFDDTHVTVEGDIHIDKAALLDRIDAEIEKGYTWDGQTFLNIVRDVPDNTNETSMHMCMRFAAAVPNRWRRAARVAARMWGETGYMYGTQGGTFWRPSDINIREVGSGSHPECTGGITEIQWAATIPGAVADAQFPIGKQIGTPLRLNSSDPGVSDTTDSEAWREFRVHLVLHEMGHTLGMGHPGDAVQVTGTLSGLEIESVMRIISGGVVVGIQPGAGAVPRLYEPTPDDNFTVSLVTAPNLECPLWLGDDPRSEDVNNRCKKDVNGDGVIDCQCAFGEGDCDGDAQCKGGLSCVDNIGARYGRASNVDMCERPAACGVFNSGSPDSGFCTEECPCGVGAGDCDDDGDCGGRLICGKDNGASVGLPDSWDVCKEPRFGGAAFNPASPSTSFCTVGRPCSYGEGDCDNDDQCAGVLTCVNDIGARFGLPSNYDVCVDASLFE